MRHHLRDCIGIAGAFEFLFFLKWAFTAGEHFESHPIPSEMSPPCIVHLPFSPMPSKLTEPRERGLFSARENAHIYEAQQTGWKRKKPV